MTSRIDEQLAAKVDDWGAGQLADYERAELEALLEDDPELAAYAEDAREIIAAARSESLALPSPAYFADLGQRIADEMRREGLPMRPLIVRRRARLLNFSQSLAASAALLSAAVWLIAVLTTTIPSRIEDNAQRHQAATADSVIGFNIASSARYRNTRTEWILRKMEKEG